jgi:hypothetical protein
VSDDVKLVEGHASIGQMFIDALDESRRHVDADRADLFGLASVLIVEEIFKLARPLPDQIASEQVR